MKFNATFTCGVAVLLAAASLAEAQSSPAPPTTTIVETEDVQRRNERAAPPTWVFNVGGGETYESDTGFTGAEGNGGWSRSVQGRLGHTWVKRRGSVELGGDVAHQAYHSGSQNGRLTYGVAGGLSHAMTRRLTWRLSGTVSQMDSQDTDILTTSGIVLAQRSLTRTQGASTDFAYQLSRRSQLNVSVSTSRVTFVDSELIPGTSMTTRVGYSKEFFRSQSIGISMGHSVSTMTGDIEGLMATWRARVGTVFAVNAAGGIRPYKLNEHSNSYSFAPGASFGLVARLGETQSVGFSYERAVEQAYGVGGTHLGDRYNANYTVAVGRRLTANLTGSYGKNYYPDRTDDYSLGGRTFNGSLSYLLGRQLSLGASYGRWLRDETGFETTTTYRTMFTISYGGAWR